MDGAARIWATPSAMAVLPTPGCLVSVRAAGCEVRRVGTNLRPFWHSVWARRTQQDNREENQRTCFDVYSTHLSHETRVVLPPPDKRPQRVPNLFVTSVHRIELSTGRQVGQVDAHVGQSRRGAEIGNVSERKSWRITNISEAVRRVSFLDGDRVKVGKEDAVGLDCVSFQAQA